jgi:protein arginine kinase
MVSGLRLDEAFERATKVDNRLQQKLEFAFHERFGFLTSCPTNVGTGMRVSVMLHLPALVFTKQIDKVFNAVSKMNLAVRGFYGEGTKALGDFYQISNQVTLGKPPEALLEDVKRVLPKIVSFEREVRNQVMRGDRVVVEDRVWRAYGLLGNARSISSDEAFELLSMVRMGVHLGILGQLDIRRVNELFLLGQPGHLQAVHGNGQALEATERDAVRATMIRQRLTAA